MKNYVFNNYIFANIKLPLQIKPDGTIETLHDYVNIHFEKCDQLPEKQNSKVNYDFLMNNLMELMRHKPENASHITDDASHITDDASHITDDANALQEPISAIETTNNENLCTDDIPIIEEPSQEQMRPSFADDIDPETQNKLILFVNREELTNKKNNESNNITFKNKRYNTHKFTAKRR